VGVTHDAEADAAYAYLVEEINRGDAAFSRVANVRMDQAALTVDFDADGRVVGIEVLGASRVLRQETISAAEDVRGR